MEGAAVSDIPRRAPPCRLQGCTCSGELVGSNATWRAVHAVLDEMTTMGNEERARLVDAVRKAYGSDRRKLLEVAAVALLKLEKLDKGPDAGKAGPDIMRRGP